MRGRKGSGCLDVQQRRVIEDSSEIKFWLRDISPKTLLVTDHPAIIPIRLHFHFDLDIRTSNAFSADSADETQ
jgi:hypothetical protein